MIHASKICEPCGASFVPAEYLTEDQATETRSCSHLCSSARARGYSTGPGRTLEGRGSDAVGSLEYDSRCACPDCERIRKEDRSAVVAAFAAQRGLSVATGPRPKMKPSDLAALAARIRKARLESYEPTMTEEADETIA